MFSLTTVTLYLTADTSNYVLVEQKGILCAILDTDFYLCSVHTYIKRPNNYDLLLKYGFPLLDIRTLQFTHYFSTLCDLLFYA